MNKQASKKILSLLLTVVMLLGLLPMSAFAEGDESGLNGEITAFAPLAEDVTEQTVPQGTDLSALNLPGTLTATALFPPTEEAEGNVSMELLVPATWSSLPEYDGDAPGEYLFTASVGEEFTVTAAFPTITITVTDEQQGDEEQEEQPNAVKLITLFADIPEDIRYQNNFTPNLPETLEGTVDGQSEQIPVTWIAEDYDAAARIPGLYVFVASPGEGYALSEDASAPIIAFMLRPMARMAGAGTQSNPLQITNAPQLAEIATLVNAGKLESLVFGTGSTASVYLQLKNDIDISGYGKSYNKSSDTPMGWIPIGNISFPFKGHFDGGGHVITGLFIKITTTSSGTGLFGYVSGSVKNLGVVDAMINSGNITGILAGSVSGNIENCYTSGSIKGSSNTGGLIGILETNSTVTKCYSTAMVNGTTYVGGIAGLVRGTVSNCYTTGAISGSGTLGGIAGDVYGVVTNCYATGSISLGVNATYAGGLAGQLSPGGKMENCAALNPVVSAIVAGRIVGVNAVGGTLANNYAFSGIINRNGTTVWSDKTLNAIGGADMSAAEGLTAIFWTDNTKWTAPFDNNVWMLADGALPFFDTEVVIPSHLGVSPFDGGTGDSDNPYLISKHEQLAKLAELVNAGDTAYNEKYYKLTEDIDLSSYGSLATSLSTDKGWIPIGYATGKPFKGHFDGDGHTITGLYINTTATYNAFGLFGIIAAGGEVTNLGVINVSINGGGYTGALAGQVLGSVKGCYATGTVKGVNNVGGLAGNVGPNATGSANGIMANCYATTTVTGTNYVGGLVGYNNGLVEYCYATGAVNGTEHVGGLTGRHEYTSAVTRVRYCAALNSSVTTSNATTANVGRVSGSTGTGSNLYTNNYAFSGLIEKGGSAGAWSSKTLTSKNGLDMAAASASNAAFWTTGTNWATFPWGTNVWTIADGKLPGLGAEVAVPLHLLSDGVIPFDGGTGESDTPYLISKHEQLAALATLVNENNGSYNDKYYKLTADLDLSGYGAAFNSAKGWIPIGNSTATPFKGNFDGDGHVIKGLYIKTTSVANHYPLSGLFGEIAGGSVDNLGVINVNITGGSNMGVITGSLTNSGVITRCYVEGTITGTGNVGGVVGNLASGTVTRCYATGTIIGGATANNIGGIAGLVAGNMSNCYTSCAVTTGNNLGGVAGNVSGSVSYCYATGAITGTNNVGGVVGINSGNVTNCAALSVSVSGTNAASTGRVAGSSSGSLAKNYAFFDLADRNGMTTAWTGKTHDGIGGADMNVEDHMSASFWNAFGWSNSIWDIKDNNLPILKEVGGPQSGDSLLSLSGRNLENTVITVTGTYSYTGLAIVPTYEVTFSGTPLIEGVDYTITLTNNINAGTATLTINGKTNYTGVNKADFTIEKAEITISSVTLAAKAYDGTTDATVTGVVFDGLQNSETLEVNTDYTVTAAFDGPNAGTDKTVTGQLTLSPTDKANNYNLADGSISLTDQTISQAELTVASITIAPKTYDGTLAATVTGVVFNGLQNGETLILDTDYAVTDAAFDSANAGDGKIVTGTLSLISTALSDNYSLADTDLNIPGQSIGKATTVGIPQTYEVAKNHADNYAFELNTLLPDVSPLTFGTLTYSPEIDLNTDGVLDDSAFSYVSGDTLILPVLESDAAETATVKVSVQSENYKDFDVVIIVSVVDKTYVTITADVPGGEYNGNPYAYKNLVVTGATEDIALAVIYVGINGTVYGPDSSAPTNAGNYRLTLSVPPDHTAYIGRSVFDFTITKKQVTVTADNKTVKAGNSLPALTVSYTGFLGADSKDNALSIQAVPQYAAKTSTAAAGKFSITFAVNAELNMVNGANYTLTHKTGTLTVTSNSGSGSGSGSGSSSGSTVVIEDEDPPLADIMPFTDVETDDWFYEDVAYVYENGLFAGTSDTTFSPLSAMTRGMMVTVLWRHAGSPTGDSAAFDDVPDGAWYASAVSWAAANGIVAGVGNNCFAPNAEITREQMAVMLYNYAIYIGAELPHNRSGEFADEAKIASWASTAVNAMYAAEIISGKGENNFDPQGKATRAEVAAVLHRFMELIASKDEAESSDQSGTK